MTDKELFYYSFLSYPLMVGIAYLMFVQFYIFVGIAFGFFLQLFIIFIEAVKEEQRNTG